MAHTTILIQGAGGDIGFECVKSILSYNQPNLTVRAAVSNLSCPKVQQLKELNCEIVVDNMSDFESVKEACRNVSKVMLIPPKKPNRVELCVSFVEHLKAVGVKHIVLLSVFGVQMEDNMFAKQLNIIEKHIKNSGLTWTFLRTTAYMELLLDLSSTIKQGLLKLPTKGEKWPPISVKDVADAIAAALLKPGYENKFLDLTGPEVLSGYEMARIMSDILNKNVRYLPVTKGEEFEKDLVANGNPHWYTSGLIEMLDYYKKGFAEVVSHDFEKLVQRKPVMLREFLQMNQKVFVQ